MTSTDPRPAGGGEAALLSVSDLTLAFGSKVIQRNLCFDVQRGSIFAVMGGSGCGKSTVLQSMIGLLRPRAGSILVSRKSAASRPPPICRSANVAVNFGPF